MAKDTCETKVLAALADAGAVVLGIERKNHIKIRWKYRGEKRTTVMAATASDRRAMKNAIAWVRKQLREIESA